MLKNDCRFMVSQYSKFFSFLYIEGWFYSPNERLTNFSIDNCEFSHIKTAIGFDHGGVYKSFGPGLGFRAEIFFDQLPENYFDINLIFETNLGKKIIVTSQELINDNLTRSSTTLLTNNFMDQLTKIVYSGTRPKVLDIGGRARSGLDRSKLFPGCDVTVLDLIAGENVNVVGDAHLLSKYFPENHFDAVYSVSVFEHLLMPWKVVLEINKILKPNGIGFIFTHQTIGLHDLPWDYFRFSENSWDGLFNLKTGFAITEVASSFPTFIIPFMLKPSKIYAEKSSGYEGSAVTFRKISDTKLVWDVFLSEIIDTNYPTIN
jgi:SAM-dependent methyltransferase